VRAFQKEIVADKRQSESTRHQARQLLRHYPYPYEALLAGRNEISDPRLIIEPVFGPDTDGASMRADAITAYRKRDDRG
jgi:hypothetical protein